MDTEKLAQHCWICPQTSWWMSVATQRCCKAWSLKAMIMRKGAPASEARNNSDPANPS